MTVIRAFKSPVFESDGMGRRRKNWPQGQSWGAEEDGVKYEAAVKRARFVNQKGSLQNPIGRGKFMFRKSWHIKENPDLDCVCMYVRIWWYNKDSTKPNTCLE